MRTLMFMLVIGFLILAYAGINYYIGLRGWQTIGRQIPFINIKIYWGLFWFVALAYLGGRLGQEILPVLASRFLTTVGAYWIAAMFYFVILIFLVDMVILLGKGLNLIPEALRENPVASLYLGLGVFTLVAGIIGYGLWNAYNPVVKSYDVVIPKGGQSINELRVAMVSDIHLGLLVNNKRLAKMVDGINQLEPDLVFLPGDIVDENIEIFIEEKMADTFKKLRPKLGSFAVLGNHEYIGGHAEETIFYLNEAGIVVLRDSYIKVADSFYIAGRDDLSADRFGRPGRKDLNTLMAGVDKSLPVILLDHQPSRLKEAEEAGVDLQLSGHTHRGQLFPNHLITRRIYEVDWGHLRKGNLQVIVSVGYGTWGPPIRIGNRPEIVLINLKFVDEKRSS